MSISKQVQEFLNSRHLSVIEPETYRNLREALLASDKQEVLAVFAAQLQLPDEDARCQAIEGLAILYGREAADIIVDRINDASSIVRWFVCGCLHDFGDLRAASVLLDRMKNDSDSQVRGMAASALGRIGAIDAMPDLHQTYQKDLEVDELGHTPSGCALDAMTSILRSWVSRQIQGTPPSIFEQTTLNWKLRGTVTAENIPFDPQGRINHTLRYAHLPMSAFGNGWSSTLDLETSLISPFEIQVEYVDPTCVIKRILIYERIADSVYVNWGVQTIVDTAAVKLPTWIDATS